MDALDRALRWLLGAAVTLPVLAFAWGLREGKVVYVLYREPKLAAIEAGVWILITALFWTSRVDPGGMAAALRRTPWLPLGFLLAYGITTILWTRVRENLIHEAGQLLLLLFLVLCLEVWADRDPAVQWVLEGGLVLGLAVATLVGLLQAVVPLAVLSPIDPGSGVSNPSFLGYKNPMALALLGQLYLAGHMAFSQSPGRRRRLLVLLMAAELAWLASLASRTAFFALTGSAALFVVLLGCRALSSGEYRRLARIGLAASGAVALFIAMIAANPLARQRAESAWAHLTPGIYLESDRGTYLLNSLAMVRDRPFGVGFGDWQTWYPVYRLHNRDLYFTEAVQTRKAHSDHVQLFAETGWPGLLLWIWFWTLLLAAPVRRFMQTGEPAALFLAAQVSAFGLAMTTDYVLEHPYGKLEFFLVAFLAARTHRKPPDPPASGRTSCWPALIVSILAAAGLFHAACVLRAAHLSAAMTERYLRSTTTPGPARPRQRALLLETVRLGEALFRTPAYRKNLCDDAFIIADTARRLGRQEEALAWARESLRLQPYSPNAMKLMAALLARSDFSQAVQWHRAAEHVLHEATHGFEGPYPGEHDRE